MANETNSTIDMNNISESMKIGLVFPEFCNCLLLGIGLYEMYQGIEIGHPVYAILFSNLLVAFICSFIGIIAFFTTFGPAYIKGNTQLLSLSYI